MNSRQKTDISLMTIGTANPSHRMTQGDVMKCLKKFFTLSKREERLYEKILCDGFIETRFIAVKNSSDLCITDPDLLNERFLFYARQIAKKAALDCLAKSRLTISEVDFLIVNTCTGYLCPGLSSYIAEDLNARTHLKTFDLMGMGCGGALPNIDLATMLLKSDCKKRALSISVEICSSTMFMGDDPGLIVSNCIFGDGASAILFSNYDKGTLKVKSIEAASSPVDRDKLRYRLENHRLRNVLTSEVPRIGGELTKKAADRLFKNEGIRGSDIKYWAIHPGGTRVLEEIARIFNITDENLYYSYQILKDYGNMSSPSVVFVLNKIIKEEVLAEGDKVFIASFGAGFSSYTGLFEAEKSSLS